MAEKKIYIGSVGPFLYDDTDDINDADGDFADETMQAMRSDGGARFDGDLVVAGDLDVTGDADVTGSITADSFALADSDDSHHLTLVWNENDSADRVLNFLVAGGDRSLTLNESFTIGDGSAGTLTFGSTCSLTVELASVLNQDLTTDAGVTFATVNGLTLTAAATGFTVAGGSTSKTLTMNDNFNVSTQLAAIAANTAKVTESTTVTSPLVLTTYDISIPVASAGANGYLSSANWSTFNSKAASGANSDITSMSGIVGTISTPTNLATKTTATISKTVGSGGDYTSLNTAIGTLSNVIMHSATYTILVGTTLSETVTALYNRHAAANQTITIQAQRYYPTSGVLPTADSATATTLRDTSVFTVNDYYNNCWVFIVDGTGTDNGFVQITDTDGANGDIIVASWPGTQPDNTSVYLIVGAIIDGGSARYYGFDISNSTITINLKGIGIKDCLYYGAAINHCNYIRFDFCGIYNSVYSGVVSVNCLRCDWRNGGLILNNTGNSAAHGGIKSQATNYLYVSNSCMSDNLRRGIYVTYGGFAQIVTNRGDTNGLWGTYADYSGQAYLSGSECSGSSGNHSNGAGDGSLAY